MSVLSVFALIRDKRFFINNRKEAKRKEIARSVYLSRTHIYYTNPEKVKKRTPHSPFILHADILFSPPFKTRCRYHRLSAFALVLYLTITRIKIIFSSYSLQNHWLLLLLGMASSSSLLLLAVSTFPSRVHATVSPALRGMMSSSGPKAHAAGT